MHALAEITRYLNDYLRLREITDYSEAHNGLQLENGGTVTRIGAAVDACGYTINAAPSAGWICCWSTTDCSGVGCIR